MPTVIHMAGCSRDVRGVHLMSVGCIKSRCTCHPTRHSTCQRITAHTRHIKGSGLSNRSQYCIVGGGGSNNISNTSSAAHTERGWVKG